jgi:hypothetical protein
MALELRMAENERDAVLVFRAYKQMHAEGLAPGSLSDRKMLFGVLGMVKGQGSAVLMAMDGDKLAGVLSLYEQGYWYSDEDRHLIDKGLYVLPEYRESGALDLLLDAAAAASDDAGLPCFIFRLDHKFRRHRGGRSKWKRGGNILIHYPET